MPPKSKTALQKMREQARKDKAGKKHKEVSEATGSFSGKKYPTSQPNPAASKRKAVEEKKLMQFMQKLTETPVKNIVNEINLFVQERNAPAFRRRFFDEVKWIPPYLIKDFAQEMVAEDPKKGIYKSYDEFIRRPDVSERIYFYLQVQEKEEEEQKRRREIAEKMFGAPEEEVDILEEPPKTYEKTKILSDDVFRLTEIYNEKVSDENKLRNLRMYEKMLFGNVADYISERPITLYQGILERIDQASQPQVVVASPSSRFRGMKNTACTRMYKDAPWLEGKVEGIYIAPVENTPIDWKETDITPYVHPEDIMEYEGEIWYRVNNKYYELQCNIYSGRRTQSDDVLTLHDMSGNPIRFRLAYQTEEDIIVQDPQLFQAELEYLDDQRRSRGAKIQKILDEPVTKQVEMLGINELANAMRKIAPSVMDYHEDGMFVQRAIEAISIETTTVRQFARKLGELVVYFDLDFGSTARLGADSWEMERGKDTVFISRVKGEYYLPEILVNLSPNEKLSEIFEDPNSTEKEKTTRHIENMLTKFVSSFAEKIYIERNPMERKQTSGVSLVQPDISLHPWRSACVNQEDVKNVPDSEVVYYNDGENVYCLVIQDLLERFRNEDYSNPVSGDILSDRFVRRFKEVYHQRSVLPVQREEVKEEKTYKILAPGLMQKIKMGIDFMEADRDVGSDTESIASSNASSTQSEFDFQSDTSSMKDYKADTASLADSDDTLVGSISDSDEEDSGVSSSKKCAQCGKDIKGRGLASMKYQNGSTTQVEFCGFDCFEEHEDWPRIRRKRSKKI